MNRTTVQPSPQTPSPQTPSPQVVEPTWNQALGARGEALAESYLEQQGFLIADRNWRSRYGELDLVAQHGDTLVAVEVKTRSGLGYGSPLSAITARKAARLRRLLIAWAREHRTRAPRLRVDAVGITMRQNAEPRIDHLQGIS